MLNIITSFFYSTFISPIDYKGQILSETIMHICFIAGYLSSLFLGILMNDLFFTLVGCCGTTVLIFFIVVFPWKFYRMNELKFKKRKLE